MEFTFKRKLIHWIFTQVFQNLEIWVCECNGCCFNNFTETFLKRCWRIWMNKHIFFLMASFRKIDFSTIFFFPKNWFCHDGFSTGKVNFCEVFQIPSFPRTETVKMVHSRREKYSFQLFSKNLVSSNWNR